jgi:hypothetical protein
VSELARPLDPITVTLPPLIESTKVAPSDDTVSIPPLKIVLLWENPPASTVSDPPLFIVLDVTLPPDDTVSLPPLLRVANLSAPPDDTVSLPPLLIVVANATPPDSTANVSPLLRVRPLLVWPALTTNAVILNYPFLSPARRLLPQCDRRRLLTLDEGKFRGPRDSRLRCLFYRRSGTTLHHDFLQIPLPNGRNGRIGCHGYRWLGRSDPGQ